jgi:hypothetical protein
MSKAEILEELPKLTSEERNEIRLRLEDLATHDEDRWQTDCDLTETEKAALDEALAEYHKNPDAGSPWREVLADIRTARKS